MAHLTKEVAIAKLERLKERIIALRGSAADTPEFRVWQRDAKRTLEKVFGDASPNLTDFNDIQYYRINRATSTRIDYEEGLREADGMLQSMIEEVKESWENDVNQPISSPLELEVKAEVVDHLESFVKNARVFIGHGRSTLWARLKIFLQDELGLEAIFYESESRVGQSIVPILENMLSQATFAILVLTAEDETAEGTKRARQNVVHEAGLFQGRLGFGKAILLIQEGLEEYSNVAGLQYISFRGDRIDHTFYELQRVLRREGLIE